MQLRVFENRQSARRPAPLSTGLHSRLAHSASTSSNTLAENSELQHQAQDSSFHFSEICAAEPFSEASPLDNRPTLLGEQLPTHYGHDHMVTGRSPAIDHTIWSEI